LSPKVSWFETTNYFGSYLLNITNFGLIKPPLRAGEIIKIKIEKMANELYKPGDKVPYSGIYKVTHDKTHAQEHEITAVFGEHFPPCRGCGHGVKFVLVRQTYHLSNHEHFKK
jgi:hypothetical protein